MSEQSFGRGAFEDVQWRRGRRRFKNRGCVAKTLTSAEIIPSVTQAIPRNF